LLSTNQVARLFANILHDSGLRQNDNFEETSGQELKDAGIDEFKKKAKAAMDGVLFMDEAYTLDPVGDKFKGAPVANELLNLAENERERLSFILAGYEDEINDKMFAFNPGFRSRFIEVHFDDFDEDELLRVWNGQREKRLWRESDDRLGRVVIRRLAKLKGRKGFGNARLVRQKLDEACSRAMARDDFDSLDLELRMEDAVGENPVHNEKLKAAVAEIEVKTGWRSVKKMVRKLVHVCGQNYERELQGQEQLPVLLNRLFLGNPGTGKTTCARLYGKVLKQLGFLSNGEVVEKTAGDLGGSVIGESKQKTIALIESCRGKILMIDEAYGLNDNFYGKQAIDAIVERVQGTEADDIAVLLLGYEEQMLEMFDKQNPGLRRRFAPDQAFVFEDYTNSQLEKILSDCCKAKKYNPTLEFREKALKKLDMQRRSESNFGNAGSVHNLLKGAVSQATSNRKCSLDGSLKLESEDIELPGDDTEVDLFVELDHLYSMEGVINELKKMKSQFDLADEEGEERPQLGHFVFSGAPGTGKTTVARSLGKILHRCGHIARPEIYETSGLKLTGEYVGSTKKVVEEALNKAKGGVLFIDEAYELGKGSFGSEACASLVEAMTNDDKYGGLVIVMAGYQADMQSMLDTNQGLKSRFKRFFDFPDWSSSDCTELFQSEASRNKFSIEDIEQSMEIIEKGFKRLLPLKGWGNARDVTKLYESVKENRAQRFSEEQASGSGGSSLEKIFMKKDIAMAMETLINARMGASGAPRKAGANVDPFAELNKLYRMEEVKEKLQQLQNTYVVANQDGEDIPPIGHFIFTGSPGTGKTSVARVMSDILYELELTTRRNVEETSGLKLQGQYIGETKKIVENYLDKAKGGVLFIDEAYTLGKGIYGSEARDTLVQAMTNHSMPV
jgi:SpoVK/Ycf46/Vps4 family AAA+-type ATPase